MFIHVVDELDALALITEGRVGEGRPSAILTLIFVGRRVQSPHWKSDKFRKFPTGMVATTVFVAVLITETLAVPLFTAYAKTPFGSIANPSGVSPTGTVATTVLVAVAITETVLVVAFAT